MDSFRNYIIKHEKLAGFLLGWIIIFADLLICNNQAVYCDSNGYDLMSDYFKNNGLFHFWIETGNEYTEYFSIRGYAWPFILAVCKVLGLGTQKGYWLFYAAFLAAGLAYALPEFISGLFQRRIYITGRIIAVILSVCFWNGLVQYPLSDVPSVVTVSWGLMLLVKIRKERQFYCNAAAAVLAGVFLGASYYIRSGCMPVIILSVLMIFLYKYKKELLKKSSLITALCLGAAIAAVPQIMINQSFNHRFSYQVPIFFNTGIANMEYYYGFQELRYETNLSGIHPEAAMISYDSVIDNILAVEDIAKEDVTLKTILKLGVKYPLEFLGLYAAKFANSIDPRYGNNIYITDLNSQQYLIMICNYFLWFIGVLGLGAELSRGTGAFVQWANMKKFFCNYFIYILAFIVPALVHLAGTHTEARYFYPCYVLLYAYLGMLCPWRDVWAFVRRRFVAVLIVCLAVFGCLNSIWNFTFENFRYAQLLMEDSFRCEDVSREEFVQENTGGLTIEYDIWSMEQKDNTYISLSGYVIALNKKSDDSRLTLVLSSDSRQYFYDINLTSNPYMEDPYIESKYIINKELVGLDEGKYQIGFLLKNGTEAGVVFTGKEIQITK